MRKLPIWLAPFSFLKKMEGRAAEVLRKGILQSFPKAAVLFHSGQACKGYLLVTEGIVRVTHLGEGGRAVVLYRVESGQSCILTTTCLLSGRTYSSKAIAETDVEAVLFGREDFEELLSLSSEFRAFVFSGFGERLLDLLLLIDSLAFQRIDGRLARLLVQRLGPDSQIEGTHRQLAEELGTVREVVSRRLKSFEEGGLVRMHRGGLRVEDLVGLRAIYGAKEGS